MTSEARLRSWAAYRERHRDRLRKRSRLYERTEKRRTQRAIYAKANRERFRDSRDRANQAYRARNPELVRQRARNYMQRTRVRGNEYRRNWRARNKSKMRACIKRWHAAHPHKSRAYTLKYLARKANAKTDAALVEQFISWINNQDFVNCTYCGLFIPGKNVHIDHIVPLSRGGDHLPDNFAVACISCNSSKHDLLLSEWPKCPDKFKRLHEAISGRVM